LVASTQKFDIPVGEITGKITSFINKHLLLERVVDETFGGQF
jgi:hypothetical protein